MSGSPPAEAYRETCYFCRAAWGACSCDFPDAVNEAGEAVEDLATLPGFDFPSAGVYVTAPNVSLCGRFYVDPTVYYGAAYEAVRERYEIGAERKA